jgi:hypothetical protein
LRAGARSGLRPRLPIPMCGLDAPTRPKDRMAQKIRFFNRHWHLPRSKPVRIGLGILLVACGLLGFLPVLGFWMIPLGLLVLSVDIPMVRRWRRQLTVWWHRREKSEGDSAPAAEPTPKERVG